VWILTGARSSRRSPQIKSAQQRTAVGKPNDAHGCLRGCCSSGADLATLRICRCAGAQQSPVKGQDSDQRRDVPVRSTSSRTAYNDGLRGWASAPGCDPGNVFTSMATRTRTAARVCVPDGQHIRQKTVCARRPRAADAGNRARVASRAAAGPHH